MNTGQLWRKRCLSFWSSVAPYIRYVISGGLGAVLILFLTVGGYFYMKLLAAVDERFPAASVTFILLYPLLVRIPLRTFLEEADILFLMPAETQFSPYMKRAILYSFTVRIVLPLLVWTVCWPVYKLAKDAPSSLFFVIAIVLLLIVYANVNGNRAENHFVSEATRRLYALLRWLVTLAALALPLFTVSWKALVPVLFLVAAYMVALRLPRGLSVHWERLIAEEKRHRAHVYTFLSGFVDVPELPRKVRRRRLLEPLARLIPHRRQSAWTYLYLLTWIRSETLAIVLRLMVVAAIVIVFAQELWLKVTAYWIGLLLGGLQLAALSRYHQHDLWTHLYPFPAGKRLSSVRMLCRNILMGIAVLLFVPLAIWLDSWVEGAVSAAGAVIVIWLSIRIGTAT